MPKFKSVIILLGDIALLYAALAITLLVRYERNIFPETFQNHLKPFSVIFIIWLVVFYLIDLYKERLITTNLLAAQNFVLAIAISVVISAILFYLFVPFFKLTPKTNLVIFTLIFGILDLSWRLTLAKIFIFGGWRNRLAIIGDSPLINEIVDYLKTNPQMGYDIVIQIKEYADNKDKKNIQQAITLNQINTIIIQPHLKKDPEVIKMIYQLLPHEIAAIDFIAFYEMIFQKAPLEEIDEGWFIEKISTRRHFYDIAKRFIDIVLSLILGILFLPFFFIIWILIKITSAGPSIYKQERMGMSHKIFILYKFRTMKIDQQGPLWTTGKDKRLTFVGKILRYTHLDEIPQLLNIIKGNISFIGPRPERRELAELYSQLSYYEIRHIIKPGLTGWAQVNYKPSASLEEAKEKLRYDIYYIKNRSLILDLLILIKTIKYLFASLK